MDELQAKIIELEQTIIKMNEKIKKWKIYVVD